MRYSACVKADEADTLKAGNEYVVAIHILGHAQKIA